MTPVPLQQPAGSFGREGFQPNGGYIQGHHSSEAWGEVIGGAPCWRPWQSWAGWCPFVLLHQALLPGHPVRMSCVLQDLHLWKPCWVSIRMLLWSKWGVIPVQTVFHFQKLPTDQCQGDGLVVWWGAKDSFFFFLNAGWMRVCFQAVWTSPALMDFWRVRSVLVQSPVQLISAFGRGCCQDHQLSGDSGFVEVSWCL